MTGALLPRIVLVLSLLVAVPAFAGADAEALRQLDFARSELAADQPDRALASAESALRLAPMLHEALIVKALAYEQLGAFREAEALLVAWKEVTGSAAWPADAQAAVDRLERRDPSAVTIVRVRDTSPNSAVTADIDPEGFRARSQAQLAAGNCQGAWATALELARLAPREPEAARLEGEAALCAGRDRDAVLAYRRWSSLGGNTPTTIALVDGLVDKLASLEVTLTLDDADITPRVSIVDEHRREDIPPVHRDRLSARFDAVPIGRSLLLVVGGRGVGFEAVSLEPLRIGERRSVAQRVTVVGLGTVRIARRPANIEVELRGQDTWPVDGPGDYVVTAGTVRALLDDGTFEAAVPLAVRRDRTVAFDPSQHLPAGVTLVGVPGGSSLRLLVETPAATQVQVELTAPGAVEIDSNGLPIAAPLQIGTVVGGVAGIFLEHPELGVGAQELPIEGGRWNAVKIDLRSTAELAASVEAVATRWAAHKELFGARQRSNRGAAITLGVLGGVLLGGGVASLAGAGSADRSRIRPDLLCRTMTARGLDAPYSCAASTTLKAQGAGLRGVGAAALGLGLGSVVLSIPLGVRADKLSAETGWDPYGE